MATGVLSAVDASSDFWVQVTIRRVIQARTDFLYVIRVVNAMRALRDRSENA